VKISAKVKAQIKKKNVYLYKRYLLFLFVILEFGWKRIVVRTTVMFLVMGIAELFPNFGPVLSFIGASTVTMMSFILPSAFYLILQEKHLVSLHQKVFHFEIIVIALIAGCAGIYSSVQGFSNPFKA